MDQHEETTYVVFGRGRDPQKLKLGNLVLWPRNPEKSDPYICELSLPELHKWTGDPQAGEKLSFRVQTSGNKEVSVNALNTLTADANKSNSSSLHVEGNRPRRFQIDEASEFLNEEVLKSSKAKDWLKPRITITQYMYYLKKLMLGKSRHPQIWMVTGVQLLTDAIVREERSESAETGVSAQVPITEMVLGIESSVLDSGLKVDASASTANQIGSEVERDHPGERVWAAQFRRLKLDFVKAGDSWSGTGQAISLDDHVDLGPGGLKSYPRSQADVVGWIDGVDKVYAGDADSDMMEDDEALFDKILKSSTPKKRALLIGGSEQRLRGVQTDLRVMHELLVSRGFDVRVYYGEMATRARILSAWSTLISQTSSGDAVVFYYSGHGGSSESTVSTERHRIQYIVPTDIEQTTKGDFRGILDVELSHLVTSLTNKTHNVTLVFDCCHSERIGRAEERGVRAWSPIERKDIDEHLRRLKEYKLLDGNLHREGNPYSVRIAAAGSDEKAYEKATSGSAGADDEEWTGNLTRELVAALQRIRGNDASWDMVLSQLRMKLHTGNYTLQRPQIEGPKMRRLFSLDSLDYFGQLGIKVDNMSAVSLMGGSLVGIQTGDTYVIMPGTALCINRDQRIAVALVETVSPKTACIRVQYKDGFSIASLEEAIAFPDKSPRSAYRVRLSIQETHLKDSLQSQLQSARFIEEFDAMSLGAQPAGQLFATVREQDGKLVLDRQDENPSLEYTASTVSDYPNAIDSVIYQLQKLAKADQLLNLTPNAAEGLDTSQVSIEYGTVEHERGRPFGAGNPASYTLAHRAYLKIQNNGKSTVYASVFLVTSMGNIEWLSQGSPSGQELPSNRWYIPGMPSYSEGVDCDIKGVKFLWPAPVPKQGSLKEAFVVILTSGKVDLGYLETEYRIRPAPGRELDKDDFVALREDFRFSVHRLDFTFSPT